MFDRLSLILPYQGYIAMFIEYFPGIGNRFHLVNIHIIWLRLPFECAIPTIIYIICFKNNITPAVVDAQVMKCSLPSLNDE